MIRIGVSACFMYPDKSRVVFGHKTLAYLEQDMARYLSRKGIMPILIPDLREEELLEFLAEMDGFVFQGGSDIAPGSYGEEAIENGRWPGDHFRDQYELRIMDFAFNNQKPIYAICRGFQLANVYFGGTLYQDIKTGTTSTLEHRNAELYDNVYHQVVCTKNSLLKDIYHSETLTVNSVHHQGIKTPGKDLVIDAYSKGDQLVEAFHYKDMEEHYVLGVQWHPEFSDTLKGKVLDSQLLLNVFLNHVKRSKNENN